MHAPWIANKVHAIASKKKLCLQQGCKKEVMRRPKVRLVCLLVQKANVSPVKANEKVKARINWHLGRPWPKTKGFTTGCCALKSQLRTMMSKPGCSRMQKQTNKSYHTCREVKSLKKCEHLGSEGSHRSVGLPRGFLRCPSPGDSEAGTVGIESPKGGGARQPLQP